MADRVENEAALITLYALQTCGHCKAVKKLLHENRHAFRTVYVDMLLGQERNTVMRYLKGINPAITFPTLVIGDETIVGYKEKEIQAALEALVHR